MVNLDKVSKKFLFFFPHQLTFEVVVHRTLFPLTDVTFVVVVIFVIILAFVVAVGDIERDSIFTQKE